MKTQTTTKLNSKQFFPLLTNIYFQSPSSCNEVKKRFELVCVHSSLNKMRRNLICSNSICTTLYFLEKSTGAERIFLFFSSSNPFGRCVSHTDTMYDFHDFGLTWKCQKIFPYGCTITSKTKINVVWNFFYTPGTLRAPSVRKILNNVDFSLWENETKIVKITHSACYRKGFNSIGCKNSKPYRAYRHCYFISNKILWSQRFSIFFCVWLRCNVHIVWTYIIYI